jgi:hypothetical protein
MRVEIFKSIILGVFGLTVLLVAIRRLRTYRLKERYALLLILVGTPFLVLAVWQNAVGQFAEWLGIQYTTFSLLCVTVFLFVMIFELLTIVSVQEQKINTLSQMVGLLMHKQQPPPPPAEPAESAEPTDSTEAYSDSER